MHKEENNVAAENPDPQHWNDQLLRNPHSVIDKRKRVQNMFAAIAPSYDLNNRIHSLWMDQAWRRKAVKLAAIGPCDQVVDVACGTGDLTLAFVNQIHRVNRDSDRKVVGIDFTFQMLPIAKVKTSVRFGGSTSKLKPGAGDEHVLYLNGDAQALPLPDEFANVVSIAFGIRNVQEPARALAEFRRVLRPRRTANYPRVFAAHPLYPAGAVQLLLSPNPSQNRNAD